MNARELDELRDVATVRSLATVRPERVDWLWPDYLPRRKVVVLDADPGTGKSTVTIDWSARVSTGSPWPDGAPNAGAGAVVLLSAEDGLADTIAPRLAAAGADPSRVFALTEVWVGPEDDRRAVPPSLPRDIGTLEDVVRATGATLVVVDVLMAYLNGSVDSHRDQDVRGVLAQLATMAERTGCCVVLIRHLNKTGAGSPMYRGGGSIGIIGAARAAYLIGRDPEDADRRILACTKSNLASEPPALAYRLVDAEPWGCARVEWEPVPVDGMTAAALLRGPADDDERDEGGELDRAAGWLRSFLGQGQVRSKDAKAAGRDAGFSDRTLARARQRLRVVITDTGFPRASYWALPADGGATDPSTQDVGTTGTTEADLHVHTASGANDASGANGAKSWGPGTTGTPTRPEPPPGSTCPDCGEPWASPGATARCRANHHPEVTR